MNEEEIWIEDDLIDDSKDRNIINKYIVPNKWRWDVFGDGNVIFDIPNDVSLWKRFWMGFLFHSEFTKL